MLDARLLLHWGPPDKCAGEGTEKVLAMHHPCCNHVVEGVEVDWVGGVLQRLTTTGGVGGEPPPPPWTQIS